MTGSFLLTGCRAIICLMLLCICTLNMLAQEVETDDQLAARALPTFTKLLRSEKDARELILNLQNHKAHSPYQLSTILTVAQRLIVAGVSSSEVVPLIAPCADAAAAINGDDGTFGGVALLMGALKIKRDAYENLYAIDQLGVPAFDLLGVQIGRTREQTIKLALDGRLKPDMAAEALLEIFTRRYGGIAEKAVRAQKKI